MPKAKAMDQCVVDVLLLNELISIRQHQAAEYFMDICAKSQMFVRSHFPYSRLIKSINKKLSLDHAKVLHDVVIQDIYPESNMAKLEECLNFISDTRWR